MNPEPPKVDISVNAAPKRKPIRSLICCVCDGPTRGRQWYERDHGYGLCPSCGDVLDQKHAENPVHHPESAREIGGKRGVHWDV